jgi:hypothetical protein
MRRALSVTIVALVVFAFPWPALASVDQASFTQEIYPAVIGSVATVYATFYGSVGQGDSHPQIIVPNELSALSSSECFAKKLSSSGDNGQSQAEDTPCFLTQTPHVGGSTTAVWMETPEVGYFQEYAIAVTLNLLVTDAAIEGTIYKLEIPGIRGSDPFSALTAYAGVQVLPRDSTAPATKVSLAMNPRAVRLSPKGEVTVLIQPLVNTQGALPHLSVTIRIPPGLVLVDDPVCVPVSAAPLVDGRGQCSSTSSTLSGGAMDLTVSPGSSDRGMNGVLLEVSPSGVSTGDFAQIVASVESDDSSVSVTTEGIAFTNVNFTPAESIVSNMHSESRGLLFEITHDFVINGPSCSASSTTHLPELNLQLWGNPDKLIGLRNLQGFVAESTSDAQYQSCYIPYVSPDLPATDLYVVKMGTCFRCGIGLVTMSSGADQVIPDYVLAPPQS